MTQEHPINPPPELVKQWIEKFTDPEHAHWKEYEVGIATRAAQWGADQELEACCEWIADWYGYGCNEVIGNLRTSRRPKPPSLKEQALLAIDTAVADDRLSADVASIVRRALEQLSDQN